MPLHFQKQRSVKNAIKAINIYLYNANRSLKDGVYSIDFIDSDYIKFNAGIKSIKLISISYLGKVDAMIDFYTLAHNDIIIKNLDFRCCNLSSDDINRNLNNFTKYLKLSAYDNILIKQIEPDNQKSSKIIH